MLNQLNRNGFSNCPTDSAVNEETKSNYCPDEPVIAPCICENYGTGESSFWLDCSSQDLDDSQVDRMLKSIVYSPQLRLLNLRGNRLTKVPSQIRLFPNLNRLNLGNNKIKSIRVKDFNFSQSATVELWLNNNQLTIIEPGSFNGI